MVEVPFTGSSCYPGFLVHLYRFILWYTLCRSTVIVNLCTVISILYFIFQWYCIVLSWLWCCIIFPHINTLYFTGHFVYVYCDVMYFSHRLMVYITQVILSMCIVMLCTSLTDWWFIFHWSFCLCVLWCYVLLSQIDGLYFTGHFVYVDGVVLYWVPSIQYFSSSISRKWC